MKEQRKRCIHSCKISRKLTVYVEENEKKKKNPKKGKKTKTQLLSLLNKGIQGGFGGGQTIYTAVEQHPETNNTQTRRTARRER